MSSGRIAALLIAVPAILSAMSANYLLLARVSKGQPLRYLAGAGWNRSGQFATRQDWERYVKDFAMRVRAPLTIKLEPAP